MPVLKPQWFLYCIRRVCPLLHKFGSMRVGWFHPMDIWVDCYTGGWKLPGKAGLVSISGYHTKSGLPSPPHLLDSSHMSLLIRLFMKQLLLSYSINIWWIVWTSDTQLMICLQTNHSSYSSLGCCYSQLFTLVTESLRHLKIVTIVFGGKGQFWYFHLFIYLFKIPTSWDNQNSEYLF